MSGAGSQGRSSPADSGLLLGEKNTDQHGYLLSLFHALGYPKENTGMCLGASTMAAQAILQGEEAVKEFNERLKILLSFTFLSTEESEAIRLRFGQFLRERGLQLYDFLAFFDSVALHHNLAPYKQELAVEGEIKNHQDLGFSIRYTDSVALENHHGGLKILDKFSGIYSRQELFLYFENLSQVLNDMDDHEPLTLIMHTTNHAIMISCCEGQWSFFDINFHHDGQPQIISTLFPTKKPLTSLNLVHLTFQAFFSTHERYLALATTIMTTRRSEAIHRESLAAFKETSVWESLHGSYDAHHQRRGVHDHFWLLIAAQNGETHTIESLLASGADPNQSTDQRKAAIFIAVQHGNLEMTELLLKYKADPQFIDIDGYSPLCMAAEKGHLPIVETLFAAGADPHHIAKNERSPLFLAAQEGHLLIVERLLAVGAKPNQIDKNGVSPLLLAAQNGHLAIVECLLKAGANPHQTSIREKMSPFFIAVQKGHLDIVQCLLDRKVNIDLPDHAGYSPLFMALYCRHAHIAKFLIEHGANLTEADPRGQTLLQVATDRGFIEVIQLLTTIQAQQKTAQLSVCDAPQSAFVLADHKKLSGSGGPAVEGSKSLDA